MCVLLGAENGSGRTEGRNRKRIVSTKSGSQSVGWCGFDRILDGCTLCFCAPKIKRPYFLSGQPASCTWLYLCDVDVDVDGP